VFLKTALPRDGVTALDPAMFRDLERPEFFVDGLNLNRTGRAIFSARLGQKVPVLAVPQFTASRLDSGRPPGDDYSAWLWNKNKHTWTAVRLTKDG
jgi:hypothetical protein